MSIQHLLFIMFLLQFNFFLTKSGRKHVYVCTTDYFRIIISMFSFYWTFVCAMLSKCVGFWLKLWNGECSQKEYRKNSAAATENKFDVRLFAPPLKVKMFCTFTDRFFRHYLIKTRFHFQFFFIFHAPRRSSAENVRKKASLTRPLPVDSFPKYKTISHLCFLVNQIYTWIRDSIPTLSFRVT